MFTPLEIAMAILLAVTLLTTLGPLITGRDGFRMTRVGLVVASALIFQLHALTEGANPAHWPLYAAGLLILVGVAGHWFLGTRRAASEQTGDSPPRT